MQVYEISGYQTGVSRSGVNFLEPADSFQKIVNGYVYRQELKSRRGFKPFSTGRLSDGTRVMGIFEHVKPDNTTELLVCTTQFLYRYNSGTDTFDQLTNAGSLPTPGNPDGSFDIASNEFYVSGTTYPFKDGTQRFVFTGPGMSDIYQYNGTDVRSFTLDNADFANPASGTLTNAWFIIWFGERLNLFNPTIGGLANPQSVLYSGIRTTTGNGDKFNVVGSGELAADTSDYINGASILGDNIVINFSRSNWSLEKTRDAFNPYIIRKIPGVLGTDAAFSSAVWSDEVRSVGKTGIITTTTRQSLRTDNKIPSFTVDEIDQENFELTYGGFDRVNGQFLFSYKDSLSDSTTQDKTLVANYEENTWSVYDYRFSVFGQTTLGTSLTWNDITGSNNPAWARMDQTEEIWNKIGRNAAVQKTLAGDDLGFVYDINRDYDDYFADITGITNASQAVMTVSSSAFQEGDRVAISGVTGMTEINNNDPSDQDQIIAPWTVESATPTSVTLKANSTNWGTYTGPSGTISKTIPFEAETIPFNPFRSEGRMVYVSHVEFLLNTSSGYLTLDILQDEERAPFKSGVIVKPTTKLKSREWITVTVNSEANFFTFVMRQESVSSQVVIPAIRIHAKPGAL